MPIIFDIESGEPYEVSEQQYHQMMHWLEKFSSMVKNTERKGSIIITSVAAEDKDCEHYKNLWNESFYRD